MPKRIQLSRKKGWRMPPNTVSVARPRRWGNPFKIGITVGTTGDAEPYKRIETNADAVAAFRFMLSLPDQVRNYPDDAAIAELRGKNLACWCKPGEPCHADVLLELANSETPES